MQLPITLTEEKVKERKEREMKKFFHSGRTTTMKNEPEQKVSFFHSESVDDGEWG